MVCLLQIETYLRRQSHHAETSDLARMDHADFAAGDAWHGPIVGAPSDSESGLTLHIALHGNISDSGTSCVVPKSFYIRLIAMSTCS